MRLPEKQIVENVPYVGLFEGAVVAINPDREKLIKLLNVSEDKQEDFKEREYLGETEEGETKLTIDFWLEEVVTKRLFCYKVTLIDKIQTNKDGTKTQYVNCTGDSTWVDDENNLQNFFTKFLDKNKEERGEKQYREAHIGEANLYTFMKAWLGGVDFWNPEVNILMDFKKLMRGNVKEITDLMTTDSVGNVVAMAEVRIKETEEGTKHYQGVYNKNALPGFKMKLVRNAAQSGNWSTDYLIKKFKEEIEGEYGSKNVFIMDTLKPFSDEMSIASSDKVIEDGDSSY